MFKKVGKISAKNSLPALVFFVTLSLSSLCVPNGNRTVISEREAFEISRKVYNYFNPPPATVSTRRVITFVPRRVKEVADREDDAGYPLSVVDSDGAALEGANNYVIHFFKESLPPARTVFSVTLYDEQGFLVANKQHRFGSDRSRLKYNADGSLNFYIQPDSPGAEKESNWLPSTPKGKLGITIRLYTPKDSALDGRWVLPAIRKVR